MATKRLTQKRKVKRTTTKRAPTRKKPVKARGKPAHCVLPGDEAAALYKLKRLPLIGPRFFIWSEIADCRFVAADRHYLPRTLIDGGWSALIENNYAPLPDEIANESVVLALRVPYPSPPGRILWNVQAQLNTLPGAIAHRVADEMVAVRDFVDDRYWDLAVYVGTPKIKPTLAQLEAWWCPMLSAFRPDYLCLDALNPAHIGVYARFALRHGVRLIYENPMVWVEHGRAHERQMLRGIPTMFVNSWFDRIVQGMRDGVLECREGDEQVIVITCKNLPAADKDLVEMVRGYGQLISHDSLLDYKLTPSVCKMLND